MVRKVSSLVKTPLENKSKKVKVSKQPKEKVAKQPKEKKTEKKEKKVKVPKEGKVIKKVKLIKKEKLVKKEKKTGEKKVKKVVVSKEEKKSKKIKKDTKKKDLKQKVKKVEKQSSKKKSASFEDYRQITLGFIGIGTIVKSMVSGLCNPQIGDKVARKIYLSPRNQQNALELKSKFKQITVAQSNQEVIDNSDWIIIGLLTTQIKDVLKDLKFKKTQTIINLAAMPNEEFLKCLNQYKVAVRACPLPPIALNVGATIVSPPHAGVENMFNALGTSVAVKTSHETYSLQGIACLMGPQYAIFKSEYDWMVKKQKIEPEIAKKYIIGTYHSICVDAMDKLVNKGHSFDDLVKEQTPGGLNEQNLKYLESKGVNKQFVDVLDATYKKMTKKK